MWWFEWLEEKLYSIAEYKKNNTMNMVIKRIYDRIVYWKVFLLDHNSFLDKYFNWRDTITLTQKKLLENLRDIKKDNRENIIISKGWIKSQWMRELRWVLWYINVEHKKDNERNILINGNIWWFETISYTHEYLHHFLGHITKEHKLYKDILPIQTKINNEFDERKYNSIRDMLCKNYPQYYDELSTMEYGRWEIIDEFVVDTYSNPMFHEYLNTIYNENNQTVLEEINLIMNKYYWNWKQIFI